MDKLSELSGTLFTKVLCSPKF